jgi:amidohydrolase
MAIVCGLAPLLRYQPPVRGRVVLLFQPAEETGEGALRVVEDPAFVQIQPDVVLGLHNLPGFPTDAVVLRRGVFSSASVGLHVHLEGIGSHAAEPEHGRSPAAAVAELLLALPEVEPTGVDGRIATVTHSHLGRPSFGLTPGHAEVWATLRARSSDDLAALRASAERLAVDTAARHGLIPTLSWREGFPESRNDSGLVDLLESESRRLGLPVVEPAQPFAWSEDFGVFAHRWPSLFFGLGTGEQSVPLHQDGYYFPEPSVATGLRIFQRLIHVLNGPFVRTQDAEATGAPPA